MRFSLQLPTDRVDAGDAFTSGPAVAEIAVAIEAAGFDACFVTDHPFPPDAWLTGGGHQALDPWVALSFAAAATRTLRLQTHVAVLGYRNPFLTAHAAASLDVLSGGRLVLGVAAGYLRGEFDALGGDFAARNEVADETLVAMKRAWTEEGVTLRGRHFDARGHTLRPRPLQRPHPPLWVGGNSRRAIRRAVEHGDGWLPFPTTGLSPGRIRTAPIESLADLETRLAYARDHAAAVGREAPLDVCSAPFDLPLHRPTEIGADRFAAAVDALARQGVTWIVLGLPGRSRGAFLEAVARAGETWIAPLRAQR